MKTINRRNEYSRAVHDWLTTECERSASQKARPNTNMVFVDVKDGREEPMGTSFINPTNARFILALVSRLISSAPPLVCPLFHRQNLKKQLRNQHYVSPPHL
ncbi:hypothetical protein V8C37DRAFT_371595 [Trichoderma ceciliae]